MTNETSAALLYGILPKIRGICGKDQQAEKALIQTFLKAEKHAPGNMRMFLIIFYRVTRFLRRLHAFLPQTDGRNTVSLRGDYSSYFESTLARVSAFK